MAVTAKIISNHLAGRPGRGLVVAVLPILWQPAQPKPAVTDSGPGLWIIEE
jgi:hypothetical protein